MAPVSNKNRFELSPPGMVVPDNFSLTAGMRNTVHGTGGFFDQRNQNVNKKSTNFNLIDKFIPTTNINGKK
jgi:hypothetical protein